VNVALHQIRAGAEQSAALVLFNIKRIRGRAPEPAFGVQVGDQKYFLKIDQVLIGVRRQRFAFVRLKTRFAQRKHFVAPAHDQKITQAILIGGEHAAHHRRLEVNFQTQGVGQVFVDHRLARAASPRAMKLLADYSTPVSISQPRL